MKIRFRRNCFKKCRILSQNFLTRQFLKQSFHKASDFDFRNLQRVRFWIEKIQSLRFWIENFTMRHIFKKNMFLKRMILNEKIFVNSKLTRNHCLSLFIVRNEENIGYESALACWVVGWGYWLNKDYVSLVWVSDIRAAGTMSHKLYGFRKILELCCSSTKQVCWLLPGMHWGFSQDLEM